MSTWQETARKALEDAYPGTLSPADIGEAIRKAGILAWSREGLAVWLRHQSDLGNIEHPAFKQYRAVRVMVQDEQETPPEVLRDLIGVAAGVMIPGPVIATWTPAERREAEEWAASEHLRASDNTGIARRPYPRLVQEAVVLAANPGMAQLAVEAWMQRKEQVEREGGLTLSPHRETIGVAQAAVTGLLVLLDGRDKSLEWQHKALVILGDHPDGITPGELSVLLAARAPYQEVLDGWLVAGLVAGVFERVGLQRWRIRRAGG